MSDSMPADAPLALLAEAILRASGTGLKNYMPSTKARIFEATRNGLAALQPTDAMLEAAWHVYTHTNPGLWDRDHMREALKAALRAAAKEG